MEKPVEQKKTYCCRVKVSRYIRQHARVVVDVASIDDAEQVAILTVEAGKLDGCCWETEWATGGVVSAEFVAVAFAPEPPAEPAPESNAAESP